MPSSRSPSSPRVLVVDDHVDMANMLAEGLADRGYGALALSSGSEAQAELRSGRVDALVTDLRMQPVDGFELLACSRRTSPTRPVIIMTAFGAIDNAVEAIRQGAYHYLAKPFHIDQLDIFLKRALDEVRVRERATSLERVLGFGSAPAGMLGKSAGMRRVFEVIERLANTSAPVLICGETGTGKGLVAAALHANGERSGARFVTLNCAALPESLLESELFGHVRGAFTGATDTRNGLFAEAHGGTLFLDEIGEMALPLQAKLLRALEEKRVRPVGSSREQEVDVRIIAATHRDLRQRVREGAFREDLLYRIEVVTVEMPALRTRPEDVPVLIEHFWAEALKRYPASPVRRLSRDALRHFIDHDWPGNVRELAHVVERLVLLGRKEEVDVAELPSVLRAESSSGSGVAFRDVIPMREMQRQYALWAYARLGRNRTRTAERLGLDFKTIGRWLSEEPIRSTSSAPPGEEDG